MLCGHSSLIWRLFAKGLISYSSPSPDNPAAPQQTPCGMGDHLILLWKQHWDDQFVNNISAFHMSSTQPPAPFLQHPRAPRDTSPGLFGIFLPRQHLKGNFDYKTRILSWWGEFPSPVQAHCISDSHPCPSSPLQVLPYCKDRYVDVIPRLKN